VLWQPAALGAAEDVMFSSAVRITDLNDYIAPAQACVVALKDEKTLQVRRPRAASIASWLL
jgi:hypothetical protein